MAGPQDLFGLLTPFSAQILFVGTCLLDFSRWFGVRFPSFPVPQWINPSSAFEIVVVHSLTELSGAVRSDCWDVNFVFD